MCKTKPTAAASDGAAANVLQGAHVLLCRSATPRSYEANIMHHTKRIQAGTAGRHELAQGAVLDSDRVSWTAAVTDWLGHIVGNVAPKTAQRYAVSINPAEPYL